MSKSATETRHDHETRWAQERRRESRNLWAKNFILATEKYSEWMIIMHFAVTSLLLHTIGVGALYFWGFPVSLVIVCVIGEKVFGADRYNFKSLVIGTCCTIVAFLVWAFLIELGWDKAQLVGRVTAELRTAVTYEITGLKADLAFDAVALFICVPLALGGWWSRRSEHKKRKAEALERSRYVDY